MFNKIRLNRKNSYVRDNEDLPILDFFNKEYSSGGGKFSLLEVGSGECRFVKKMANLYPGINITCVEINPELAKIAKDAGFETINDSVLNIKPSKEYDVVHCSHVIEHFGYPQVVQLLDYLIASTKVGGHLIIRTPLMYDKFYYDIDHIRPYPPEAVLTYFTRHQQQKQGNADVEVETLWYRTSPKTFETLHPWNLLYQIKPVRLFVNKMIEVINRMNYHLWDYFRHPAAKPDGYVMILKVVRKK